MSGKKHNIRAITQSSLNEGDELSANAVEQAAPPEWDSVAEAPEDEFLELEDELVEDRFTWLPAAIAALAGLAWTALYGWALRDDFLAASSLPPAQWVRWIIDWSVPVLLIGVIWLIAMRNSVREANRFSATASLLSKESAELETRLTVVNRELSLAREFLGSQSRELESLGRIAAERISTHAQELQSLIKDNGAQVNAIATTSETALANMTSLRDDLPVVANSARDVSNQVGLAGRTASDQLDKLVSGFERLNQFGKASENQVSSLTKRVKEIISSFESQLEGTETTLAQRFEALQVEAERYRLTIDEAETKSLGSMNERIALLQSETRAIGTRLKDAETEAMEQVRATRDAWETEIRAMIERLQQLDLQAATASQTRIKELHLEAGRFDDKLQQRDVKFFEEMTRRQSEFETRETQATEVLSQRFANLDEMLSERREAQAAETEKLVEQSSQISAQLEKLTSLITQIADQGQAARDSLGHGLGELEEQLKTKRASLAETEAALGTLTESGIRLLEIIQSGAKHSREDLPQSIEQASAALANVEQRAAGLGGAMFQVGQKGEDLSNYLIQTNDKIEQTEASIDALQTRLVAQSEEALSKLDSLRGGLAELATESESFAGEAQSKLRDAINDLEKATRSAIETLDTDARTKVADLAETISDEAVTALERALRNDSAETIGKLEQAAAHASGVGREATVQLRDQLAKVNELTGNLEQRVNRARELAEEQIDNDFARRMALITDSLNSSAIDISSALSTEVADTAWDAYLKGDRGIFTRRAVRLLDSADSREIAELYQSDASFKANVSRYIHDFESMLRSMLSTRDGNALSVTVLGSDMGKLYVALAQSIERLRN